MRASICLMILLVALFANPALGQRRAPPSEEPRDERFFGTYYSPIFEKEICRRYRVKFLGLTVDEGRECRTIRVTDIVLQVNYEDRAWGGFISGRGQGRYGDGLLLFSLVGSIIETGLARASVSAMMPDFVDIVGDLHLSDDGLELSGAALQTVGSLRKDLGPNKAPVAVIQTPADGSTAAFGDTLVLTASAKDEDPSIPEHRMVWTSDIDRRLKGYAVSDGKQASLFVNDLSPGKHKITFTATDRGGLSGTATVGLEIANAAPDKPVIIKPAVSDEIYAGIETFLVGQAFDLEDGQIGGAKLTWSSDQDGKIALGSPRLAALKSPGAHSLRLTANDSLGTSGFAERLINVLPYNGKSPPQVLIAKPPYYKWRAMAVLSGEPVDFVAQVRDHEDPFDKLETTWQAVQATGSGAPFGQVQTFAKNTTRASFTPTATGGATTTYRITLTAKDPDGMKASDSMTIFVLPKPIL